MDEADALYSARLMPPTIRTIGAIALVAGIGALDAAVSSRLPFSVLYFAPVAAAAWYAGATCGTVVAVAALAARLASDIHWNGIDGLTVVDAIIWSAALCVTPRLTAWTRAR